MVPAPTVFSMNDTRIIDALDLYDAWLHRKGYPVERFPEPTRRISPSEIGGVIHHAPLLSHARHEVREARTDMEAGRRDEALVRLGFVQGVLFLTGLMPIHDIDGLRAELAAD